MASLSPEIAAYLAVMPVWSGNLAGLCRPWNEWLHGLAAIGGDRATLTRCAAAAGRLLLPYYEKSFRGDARPRVAIETAERFVDNETAESREVAEQLRSRISRFRYAGDRPAAQVAWWTLRTALAASPEGDWPPDLGIWSLPECGEGVDYRYCSFMALTLAAHALRDIVHKERRPKWTVANDDGKSRVVTAVRKALVKEA